MGRHQMANFGPMQYWEFPFLLTGFISFIKNWKNPFVLTIFYSAFCGSIFRRRLQYPVLIRLRSLLMVIPLTMIVVVWFLLGNGKNF